jgi:hypothetical protein
MTAKELTCPDSRGERNRRTEQCPVRSITYPYHKINILKYVERPFYIHLRSQRRVDEVSVGEMTCRYNGCR